MYVSILFSIVFLLCVCAMVSMIDHFTDPDKKPLSGNPPMRNRIEDEIARQELRRHREMRDSYASRQISRRPTRVASRRSSPRGWTGSDDSSNQAVNTGLMGSAISNSPSYDSSPSHHHHDSGSCSVSDSGGADCGGGGGGCDF